MKLLLLIAIVVGIYVYFRTRQMPEVFVIERSKLINASPNQLKALLADFARDGDWNPFLLSDPELKVEMGTKTSGVGASMAWKGKKSGAGNSEILVAEAHRVERSLNMVKPIKAENLVEFTFDLEGDDTRLTWRMSGQMTRVQKLFNAFVPSDKMIDKAFRQGLDNIAAIFED